jgi:hypothetical protein
MAAKPAKKVEDIKPDKEIVFKCKFCGETKPLRDMIVMHQYYPQICACSICAKGSANFKESA